MERRSACPVGPTSSATPNRCRAPVGITLRPNELSAQSIRGACRRVLDITYPAATASTLQDEVTPLPEPAARASGRLSQCPESACDRVHET